MQDRSETRKYRPEDTTTLPKSILKTESINFLFSDNLREKLKSDQAYSCTHYLQYFPPETILI